MELWSFGVFALAVAIATATPGPTIVILVARVLARGRAGNTAFALGLVAGDILWLAAAVFGIAALATFAHEVMVALKYLGAAYLVYLAIKMWTAPVDAGEAGIAARDSGWRAAAGGVTVALANPKTMMFYLALVPNLLDVTALDGMGFLQLAAAVALIYGAVLTTYIAAAHRARFLFRSARAMRTVNRSASAVMAGTAVVVATRS